MRKLNTYYAAIITSAVQVSCLTSAFAQNISINTTGAANSTSSMLEVLQPNTANNQSGIFSRRSGALASAGSTAYAFWSEVICTGATSTNVAGYFSATSATKNYAIIVPNTGGSVGIGTIAPLAKLHVAGSADATQFIIQANATQSNINPLIKLQNSAGTDLLHIHSDDITNTFIGLNAGKANSVAASGVNNVFIGDQSGSANVGGNYNSTNGSQALQNNTYASNNIAIGTQALVTQSYNGGGAGPHGTATILP